MKLKKNPGPDECRASRCKQPIVADQLCAQHHNQWVADGSPPLAAPTPASERDDLAVVRAELEPVRSGVEQALQFAASVEYDARYGEHTGLQMLGQLRETGRAQLKVIEERRTSITKPLLEAKRAADALFDPTKQVLRALVDCCTKRLEDYERGRLAAQQQALAEVGLGARDEHTLAIVHGATELPDEVTTRKVWRLEITDFAAVPDEFKVFNEALALSYVRSKKGQCQIPGVKIVEDVKVVAS